MTHTNKLDLDRKRCLRRLFREVAAELETGYVSEAQRLESLSDDQFDREMRAKGRGRSEVRSFEVWIAEIQRLELKQARQRTETAGRKSP
jgi:hypothetical protein